MTVSRRSRAEVKPLGPKRHQPTIAIMGTTVCSNWLATSAHVSRSSKLLSTTWKTMNVTVIATSPMRRKAANAGENLFGLIASNVVVTPTTTLESTVKKAKMFSARPTGLPPNTEVLCAETRSWTTTPASTASAVTENHNLDHFGSMPGTLTLSPGTRSDPRGGE